jgi:hypothetical protein
MSRNNFDNLSPKNLTNKILTRDDSEVDEVVFSMGVVVINGSASNEPFGCQEII